MKWIAPTDLLVDATYQRDLSERSIRLIRKMIENFNWNRLKPPIVVQVGPASLHIVDGQHSAIVAATAGTLVPLGLKAMKVDPALGSSVFITTFTDVIGFASFLGLATIFLRYLVH